MTDVFYTRERLSIEALPVEVLLHVFSFLTAMEIHYCVMPINHNFFRITTCNFLWKLLYIKDWKTHQPKRRCIQNNDMCTYEDDWRRLYISRHKVHQNWKMGKCTARTLRGHSNWVSCLQIKNGILVSGALDDSIIVWDVAQGRDMCTLRGHTKLISCIQLQGSILVSGSWDRTLRIWNVENGTCIKTLAAHSHWVRCAQLDRHVLASGSRDGSIRLWDLATQQQVRTLRWDEDTGVFCLQFDQSKLVCGTDRGIEVWDMRESRMAHYINSPYAVVALQYQDHRLLSAFKNTIQSWDLRSLGSWAHPSLTLSNTGPSPDTPAVEHYIGHKGPVYSLQFDDHKVVSGSSDKTLRVWDMATRQCTAVFHEQGAVWCPQFEEDTLVSGCLSDITVRCFSSDPFNRGIGVI